MTRNDIFGVLIILVAFFLYPLMIFRDIYSRQTKAEAERVECAHVCSPNQGEVEFDRRASDKCYCLENGQLVLKKILN